MFLSLSRTHRKVQFPPPEKLVTVTSSPGRRLPWGSSCTDVLVVLLLLLRQPRSHCCCMAAVMQLGHRHSYLPCQECMHLQLRRRQLSLHLFETVGRNSRREKQKRDEDKTMGCQTRIQPAPPKTGECREWFGKQPYKSQ